MNDQINIGDVIKKQFAQLPKEVQLAVTDTNLIQKTKDLSAKYSLRIDQLGSLQNEIIFVMIGLEPSSVFIENISNELKINKEQANLIANDANETIFKPIRIYLRKWEEDAEKEQAKTEPSPEDKTISDLERLGGFSIEPQQGKDDRGVSHIESKARLINEIENPPAVETRNVSSVSVQNNTEPMIDRLLSGPAVSTEQKSEVTPVTSTPTIQNIPKPPVKASESDLYREPIE